MNRAVSYAHVLRIGPACGLNFGSFLLIAPYYRLTAELTDSSCVMTWFSEDELHNCRGEIVESPRPAAASIAVSDQEGRNPRPRQRSASLNESESTCVNWVRLRYARLCAMSPSLHLHAPHLHLHHGHRDGQQQPGGTAYTDATPKGAHYAATLDTIRRLALWNSAAPALAKGDVNWNAAPTTTTAAARTSTAVGTGGMDWNEVLRKFRKHNPNRSRAFPLLKRHDLRLNALEHSPLSGYSHRRHRRHRTDTQDSARKGSDLTTPNRKPVSPSPAANRSRRLSGRDRIARGTPQLAQNLARHAD